MALFDIATKIQELVTFYAVQPLLILFFGIFVGKVLEQTLLFVFNELKLKGQRYTIIAYITMWIVYIATLCLALASIHTLGMVLWFFAGVLATVALLWIILGLKDFFPNLLSYHAVANKFKAGSLVKSRLVEGTVIGVQLIDTHVRTASGDDVYVPNSTMRRMPRSK